MKILILFTPRSKSTIVHHILSKKYNLKGLRELFAIERLVHKNQQRYKEIIDIINNTDNICLKLNSIDFIEMNSNNFLPEFFSIDFKSFDKIIFITRKDYMSAIPSNSYIDRSKVHAWHRYKNREFQAKQFNIDLAMITYYGRVHAMFEKLKPIIINQAPNAEIYHYDFDNVEQNLLRDFDLTAKDFDIETLPCDLDYKKLALNYDEFFHLAPKEFKRAYDEILATAGKQIDDIVENYSK